MSNTVITSYTDISGNISKPGKQLVVVVNKDGTVSFEKSVFQSLLDEKGGENTSVSLVHINEDGKPADASDDSSDDDNVPHVNLTVNAFYDAENCDSFDKGALEDSYLLESRDYFLIGFQNDHCYTALSAPAPPASALAHTDTPEGTKESNRLEAIPASKKITIIENKVIPKDKNFFNLNTADAQIILRRSDILKKIVDSQKGNHNLIPLNNKTTILNAVAVGNQNSNLTSESSAESFHDDRDSDSDYHSRGRKTVLKPGKPKAIGNKSIVKKIELKKSISNIHQSDIPPQYKHAKTYKVKSFSKANSVRNIVAKKLKKSILSKNEANRNNQAISDPKLMPDSESVKDLPKAEPPKPVKPALKKDKKPPAHITALLNDMTSLFSTPDVIRRISTDSKQAPKTPDRVGSNIKKSEKEFLVESPTTPDKVLEFPKNKIETKTYSNTAPKTVNKIIKDINQPLTSKASTEAGGNMMAPLGMATLSPYPEGTKETAASPPLSPSLELLGLHPEEEDLPADLLMHVAQLVQSSENLQEVIDKQVLAKVTNVPKSIPMNSVSSPSLPKIDIVNNQVNLMETAPVSTPPPRKEPIQIVRSNGRIITLPPIEAPATRSSKRKSLLNTSIEQQPAAPVAPTTVPKAPTPVPQTPIPKQVQSNKKIVHKTIEQVAQRKPDIEDDENVESDESWNSEDDPDRLWCICKQPHNNRFMICCDLCEDWFHGKCVNITKTMGQEMEEKGVEWRCPNCLKKKSVAKPNSPRKSTDSKSEASLENEAYSHLPTGGPRQGAGTSCIVCKKPARASSIYCSDGCILKHAQGSLASSPVNAPSKVLSTQSAATDKANPDTRVIVYERETGRCLAGTSAPTTANLKDWLQENPTFEVVQPGTINRPSLNLNKARSKMNTQKIQSVLKIGQDKQIILMQPPKGTMAGSSPSVKQQVPGNKPLTPKIIPAKPQTPKTLTPKSLSLKLQSPKEQVASKPPTPKLQISKQQTTVKPGIKSPPTPKTPTSQQKQPSLKSPTTPTHSQKRDDTKHRMNSTEPIRENVRKTLQEQLSIRMSETKDVKFNGDEIQKFAIDTEHELHDLFKDVGIKYKAKYRSLMFNLKDRKNLSLWQKICDRSITPKQLVRLSPEELASQELAQWRDQEAKHQLELIKKSELDLLACSKTYVLKTHKGEEVIESRTTDTTELDPNVAVEDIVSALNHVPGEDKIKDDKDRDSRSPSPSQRHRHHSHPSHHKHSKHKSRSHSKSSKSSHKKDQSVDRNKISSEKRGSSKERKSSSRNRHRKDSRDEDRSHRDSKGHGRSRKSSSSEHRHKSKTDHKSSPSEKAHKRSHSKERDKRRSSSSSKEGRKRSLSKESDNKHSTKKIKMDNTKDEYFNDKQISALDDIPKPIETDILSKNFLEDSDIFVSQENIGIESPPTPGTPDILDSQQLGAESDQEPSSTVSCVWTGSISMVDVAKFNVNAYEVSGHCDYITKDLPLDLDIVGRISPELVWDYINKMKKQGNKDIMVIKLLPSNEEEKIQYNVFLSYLNARNRLGVVQGNGGIKDFYILPLTSHAPLPSVLLPLNGPGFEDPRPQLLLGIIVGQKKKRSGSHILPIPSKLSKLKEAERSYTPPPAGATPPGSPRRPSTLPLPLPLPHPVFHPSLPALSSTVKSKIAASLASADDEPYSPGGSDSISQSPPPAGSTDLQRKMEELNRKIEESKKQILNMAGNMNSNESLDEPYSPSRPMSPEAPSASAPLSTLSSISLPYNLHEILASIQKQSKPAEPESYVPTAISVAPGSAGQWREQDVDMRIPPPNYSGPSKLASLSEAELLSMVPDDEVLPPFPPLPPQPPPPPPYKRPHPEMLQPPPPGMEDEH